VVGSREEIAHGIGVARADLEQQLERPVVGFRSPRLDRSPDLPWALERAGYRYDSSYPDVDRENMTRFGAGVRINLPYWLPVMEGGRVRPSACVELPVSAPDCIQPLFQGYDLRSLRRAVREKIAFIQATGGVYVGIVHAGVFGAKDAARRADHLAYVHDEVRRPDVWLTTVSEIAEWWLARERIVVSFADDQLQVVNRGDHPLEGVRLVVESKGRETVHDLPVLAPAERVVITLGEPIIRSQAVGT